MDDNQRKATVDKRISDMLGITHEDLEVMMPQHNVPARQAPEVTSSGNADGDMESDLDFARRTVYETIQKNNELVDYAIFFAKERQDPKSVESAAIAQKVTLEATRTLIDLHKTRKEIERISTPGPGNTRITQNIVFSGSTSDLLKMTKEKALKEAADTITIDVDQPKINSSDSTKKEKTSKKDNA